MLHMAGKVKERLNKADFSTTLPSEESPDAPDDDEDELPADPD